ncbi:hypothetical protein WA026_004548 [Henosepilachna vigintioctopunctata]|uniref:PHD-type domain-containing protein n=1 Tax=Henosepilachna vigintioctopunctata TaxID=420089 RepID=A0AAW1V7Y4_9CUCU
MANKKHTCKGCSEIIKRSEYSIKCFGACDRWYHRKCSQLTNQEFTDFERGLTKEKWICGTCCTQESHTDEEDGNEAIKIKCGKGSKRDDPDLGSIMSILKQMNLKLEKFEESMNFNGEILSELQNSIKGIKIENRELRRDNESLKVRISELEKEMSNMKNNANKEELQEKRNNLMIIGLENNNIQESTKEVIKICKTLDTPIQEDDFVCKIISSKNGKKQLQVKFKEVNTRDKLIQKRKEIKLTLQDCSIGDKVGNIYVNEDLPLHVRKLYHQSRELKKYGFKFVWCKNGNIFARKTNNAEAKRIFSESQIKQMILETKQ